MRTFIKSIFFSFLFIVSLQNLQAQDFWEQLPFPDTLDISRVAVNNQGHIFAGTVTGGSCVSNGIYRSTDNGQNWQHVFNTGTLQIHSIGIDKTGHVYIGSAGATTFWKSTDNGQSWQSLPFHHLYAITKIYSFGNDSLLLGCSKTLGALLLRTHDGGITFDTLFQTYNHVSESVRDIAIAPNGDIYIGLQGWFPDAGGLFKSIDNGETWQCIGLQGYQVKNIEINAQGDVFIGARDMGTYAIYHDNPTEIKLLHEAVNEGLVLNSAGHIYAGTEWPNGIMRSIDNGTSFSYINSGLPLGAMGNLTVDSYDFIYALTNVSGNLLYKTYNSTITAFSDNEAVDNKILTLYPNPAVDIITCRFLSNMTIGSRYKVSIMNINNQIVFQEDVSIASDIYTLNVAILPPGLFYLSFKKDQKTVTTKFAKL